METQDSVHKCHNVELLFNHAFCLMSGECLQEKNFYKTMQEDRQFLVKNRFTFAGNKRKRCLKARDLLDMVIQAEPNFKYGFICRGIVRWLLKRGISVSAIADFTSALEVDPDCSAAYFFRASAKMGDQYCEEPRSENALLDLNRALELSPLYGDAYLLRSDIKKSKRDREGARRDIAFAIAVDPFYSSSPWVFYSLGKLEKALRLYEEAAKNFTRAIELNPKGTVAPFAFMEKIKFIRKKVGLSEVIEECQKALKAGFPFVGLIYLMSGRARRVLKDYHGACQEYSLLIVAEPDNEKAYRARAFVRKKLGDKEGAAIDRKKYKKLLEPPF